MAINFPLPKGNTFYTDGMLPDNNDPFWLQFSISEENDSYDSPREYSAEATNKTGEAPINADDCKRYSHFGNIDKEDNHMSFAGVMTLHDRVTAFTASKCTQGSATGTLYEDTKREPIPKLFENDAIIFVTNGANKVNDHLTNGTVRLEEWIKEHIGQFTTVSQVTESMHRFLGGNRFDSRFPIELVGAEKLLGDSVPPITKAVLDPNGDCKITRITTRKPYLAAYLGDERYTSFFQNSNALISAKTPVEVLSAIRKAIDFFDMSDSYNPVGGEIEVRMWPNEGVIYGSLARDRYAFAQRPGQG